MTGLRPIIALDANSIGVNTTHDTRDGSTEALAWQLESIN